MTFCSPIPSPELILTHKSLLDTGGRVRTEAVMALLSDWRET